MKIINRVCQFMDPEGKHLENGKVSLSRFEFYCKFEFGTYVSDLGPLPL